MLVLVHTLKPRLHQEREDTHLSCSFMLFHAMFVSLEKHKNARRSITSCCKTMILYQAVVHQAMGLFNIHTAIQHILLCAKAHQVQWFINVSAAAGTIAFFRQTYVYSAANPPQPGHRNGLKCCMSVAVVGRELLLILHLLPRFTRYLWYCSLHHHICITIQYITINYHRLTYSRVVAICSVC